MAERAESVLEKAIRFAVKAHSGQKRKLTGAPYILHPLEAASIASSVTADEEILAAVVLHDTVEDCGVEFEELREVFGERIVGLVLHETEDKMRGVPPGESWQTRKELTLSILRQTEDKGVKIMWLADKLSNIRSIYMEYQKLGDKVWGYFNQKDKSRHAWYYRTAVEYLKEFSDEPAYKELAETVEKVFFDV